MEQLAPDGPVYQAGTLSGNPVAMAAGLATLKLLNRPGFYDELSSYTQRLVEGMQLRARDAGIPFTTTHIGGMFGLFFTDTPEIRSFADVMTCDKDRFSRFFHLMLDGGVYLAPSAYEAGFTSIAHGEKELSLTLDVAEKAFSVLRQESI